MGLFAKKNIKSGTIVSFYPVLSIAGIDFGHSSVCLSSSDVRQGYFRRDTNNDTNDSEEDSDWNGNYLQYIIGSRPLAGLCIPEVFGGNALFVDVEPSQVDCVGWIGHYVKDGAAVEACEEAGILEYYQRLQHYWQAWFFECSGLLVTKQTRGYDYYLSTNASSYNPPGSVSKSSRV